MAGKRTILLIDDEPQMHRFLRPTLDAAGFALDSALTGREALAQVKRGAVEVILLDLGLPDLDGLEVLREIRLASAVPVIILSARDDEAAKVAALDLGADDYVNKPFSVAELMARLRTALRHALVTAGATPVVVAGDLAIDTLAHQVTLRGERLKLTPKEYDLLQLLARHTGRVMTHRHILTSVWGVGAWRRCADLASSCAGFARDRSRSGRPARPADRDGRGLSAGDPRDGLTRAGGWLNCDCVYAPFILRRTITSRSFTRFCAITSQAIPPR